MALIDLSHPIAAGMPVYPGDPDVLLARTASFEADGFTAFRLSTGLHAGTHIDAPLHLSGNTADMASLPLSSFHGKGCLLDARGRAAVDVLPGWDGLVAPGDIVLILTGFDASYGTPAYYSDHPVLTEAMASFLISKRIRMLCLDTPSPDRHPHAIHRMLLGSGIPIAENLAGLEKLLGLSFTLTALPLKIHAEASPARIAAIVENAHVKP